MISYPVTGEAFSGTDLLAAIGQANFMSSAVAELPDADIHPAASAAFFSLVIYTGIYHKELAAINDHMHLFAGGSFQQPPLGAEALV